MDKTYTVEELAAGVALATGQSHKLRVLWPELRVRLEIDPREAKNRNERFTLRGKGGSSSYTKALTIKDDLTSGDAFVDLVFKRLVPKLSYSLEVDLGTGEAPHMVFEELTWAELEPIVYRRG